MQSGYGPPTRRSRDCQISVSDDDARRPISCRLSPPGVEHRSREPRTGLRCWLLVADPLRAADRGGHGGQAPWRRSSTSRLYEAFPAAEARRLVERFEWHYTPKPCPWALVPRDGSWLDMAKSELSVLLGQCLDRRIPDKLTLIEEVAAWQDSRTDALGDGEATHPDCWHGSPRCPHTRRSPDPPSSRPCRRASARSCRPARCASRISPSCSRAGARP
jgi:hypothetical protein